MFKFDETMISNGIMAALGAVMGYVSQILSIAYGIHEANFLILLAAIFLAKTGMEYGLKIKQPWKWWLTNGAALCFLMWLVVWTVFFNIGL